MAESAVNADALEATHATAALAKFRPIRDNVLVKLIKPPSKIGSLFIPESAMDKCQEGIVVAIGPGDPYGSEGKRIEMWVKPGDHVVWSVHASGNEVRGFEGEDGEEYRIFREFEFQAVREADQAAQ